MSIRRISSQSVPVRSGRALAFYRDILKCEVQIDVPSEQGWRWIFVFRGSDSRIQFARSEDSVVRDKPVLALVLDADCAEWQALGVQVSDPPQDAPWAAGVRWATIRDSGGNPMFVESLAR